MLTRRLVWVAVENGEIQGVLIAFAAHGFFQPACLIGRENRGWVYGLLKKAFRDAFDRGYYFYIVHANPSRPKERKLVNIILRRGGKLSPSGDGWYGGSVEAMIKLRREEKQSVAC